MKLVTWPATNRYICQDTDGGFERRLLSGVFAGTIRIAEARLGCGSNDMALHGNS